MPCGTLTARPLSWLSAGLPSTCFDPDRCRKYPSSKTGDYSDVKVVSPFGEIPWKELSRLSDHEMKILMIDVVNHSYAFLSILFCTDNSTHADRAAQ